MTRNSARRLRRAAEVQANIACRRHTKPWVHFQVEVFFRFRAGMDTPDIALELGEHEAVVAAALADAREVVRAIEGAAA
ncbi:hypothetical protein [Microbaculum marinum]|uniref:Uncharacterized protein n=1 Tax=Microbaculum marinum TaxID=1764581 RepID=A0AAW9RQR9_9HYPH